MPNTADNQEKQKRRYSDQELSIIEGAFSDNEDWLILFRKFLLQGDMSEEEMVKIKNLTDQPAIFAVLKKTLNPELDKLAPLNQTVDIFSSMDMAPTPIDHALLSIKSRWRVHRYIEQRFDVLEGKEIGDLIDFDSMHDPEGKMDEDAYIDFVARNFLLGYIDTQGMKQLLILARMNESPEQTATRLRKNSNK